MCTKCIQMYMYTYTYTYIYINVYTDSPEDT